MVSYSEQVKKSKKNKYKAIFNNKIYIQKYKRNQILGLLLFCIF